MSAELCNNVSRYDGVKYGYRSKTFTNVYDIYKNSRTEAFGEFLKTVILFGSETLSTENYSKVYDKCLRMRRVIVEEFGKIFADFGAVLMPACSKMEYSDKDFENKYLSLEESRQLLNSVSGENMIRDYCILTLFLNCGLRLAELVSLNLHDVDFNKQSMVVTGKGNKQRVVFLNNACISALKDYLKIRPVDSLKGDDRNALFISRLNKRIGRQAVQLMVYKSLEKIGLDGQHYSVHKLRHTAATLTYQYGDVDVLILKEMLGHENLSTTEIYTHLESKQLREAAASNPLSNEKNNLKTEK
jgi:integrase